MTVPSCAAVKASSNTSALVPSTLIVPLLLLKVVPPGTVSVWPFLTVIVPWLVKVFDSIVRLPPLAVSAIVPALVKALPAMIRRSPAVVSLITPLLTMPSPE